MAETIRAYLAEVELRLRDTVSDEALQSVLAETEGHLRESASEIESLGFSKYESEQKAVASFGEAREFGEALEKVERPRIWAAPKSWAERAAAISTFVVLLGPLLVSDYRWYHADETFSAWFLLTPPLVLVLGAALLGARVRVRSLYLVGLAGGFLLVPILAARFVGSMNMGGIVVRSLELRSQEKGSPAWMRSQVPRYERALRRFDRLKAEVDKGAIPHLSRHLSTINYEVNVRSYIGPVRVDGRLVPEGALSENYIRSEARLAWQENGPEIRQWLESGIEVYSRWAREAQERLDEPYWYRATTMGSWGLVFALVWGTALVLMQAAGSILRRQVIWLIRLAIPELGPNGGKLRG